MERLKFQEFISANRSISASLSSSLLRYKLSRASSTTLQTLTSKFLVLHQFKCQKRAFQWKPLRRESYMERKMQTNFHEFLYWMKICKALSFDEFMRRKYHEIFSIRSTLKVKALLIEKLIKNFRRIKARRRNVLGKLLLEKVLGKLKFSHHKKLQVKRYCRDNPIKLSCCQALHNFLV